MQRHLLHVFSTFGVGGPQVRTCDVINHFGDRYRHTVIAMDGCYDCRAKIQPYASVDFVEVSNSRRNPLLNILRFAGILRRLRPDTLLTYNWGASEWGLANVIAPARPHWHWEEGFGSDEAGGQKSRRILARRVFLARATIVVPSRTLETIALKTWKFPPQRIRYIPNGVDLARFTRTGPAPSTAEPLLVGTVAKLRSEKNLARLIRVFAEAAKAGDVRMIIAGDGPERQSLEQIAADLQVTDRITFAGYVADPSSIIRSLDVFAISSDTEQMPISVLEAMASSCPVVGTRVGDIEEMIAESNRRFLCNPSDETAFATNLRDLLDDPVLRQRLGDDNRTRCRDVFNIERMFEKYREVYDTE